MQRVPHDHRDITNVKEGHEIQGLITLKRKLPRWAPRHRTRHLMSTMMLPLLNPRAQATFLRTIPAIRTRCAQVHDLAMQGALQYFEYDPAKLDDVIAFCASIMEVRRASSSRHRF